MMRSYLLTFTTALLCFNSIECAVTAVTKANYAQLIKNADKPLIIDVYAQWCNPCKVMKPIFEAYAEQNKNKYHFAALDYDEAPEITASLGITGFPTLVVMKNGKPIGKIMGQKSAEKLDEEINKVITLNSKSYKEYTQKEMLDKLQDVIQQCSTDDLKQLIDAKADISATLPNGLTPLLFAISLVTQFEEKALALVEMLIAHGASTKAIQLKGMPQPLTPYQMVEGTTALYQKMVDLHTRILRVLSAQK